MAKQQERSTVRGREFFGWEEVDSEPTKRSLPAGLRAVAEKAGSIELRKGDPDAGGGRVLVFMVKGGDGPDRNEPADPEIIAAYAQRECVLEELRLDGVDLAGNNDEMTLKAATALIRKGEREKAEVVVRYREDQIERTSKRARALLGDDLLSQAEAAASEKGK